MLAPTAALTTASDAPNQPNEQLTKAPDELDQENQNLQTREQTKERPQAAQKPDDEDTFIAPDQVIEDPIVDEAMFVAVFNPDFIDQVIECFKIKDVFSATSLLRNIYTQTIFAASGPKALLAREVGTNLFNEYFIKAVCTKAKAEDSDAFYVFLEEVLAELAEPVELEMDVALDERVKTQEILEDYFRKLQGAKHRNKNAEVQYDTKLAKQQVSEVFKLNMLAVANSILGQKNKTLELLAAKEAQHQEELDKARVEKEKAEQARLAFALQLLDGTPFATNALKAAAGI